VRSMPEELLLYFGCMIRYRLPQVKDAILKILDKAGVNYKLLKEEFCCGDLLFRSGQLREAKSAAERLIKLFEEHANLTIVTPCAGCYHALTVDYSEILE